MSKAETIALHRMLYRCEKLSHDFSILPPCRQWEIPEKELEDILIFAQDLYELVKDENNADGYFSFRFINWFCKTFRFACNPESVRKALIKSAKEKYI